MSNKMIESEATIVTYLFSYPINLVTYCPLY